MYKSYEAGRGVRGYFIEGCESMANFPNITEHMLRRGFTEEEIKRFRAATGCVCSRSGGVDRPDETRNVQAAEKEIDHGKALSRQRSYIQSV